MSNNNENKRPGEELTAAAVSGAIAPTSKPDPLLEELHVVRLEGRYFCFDKHEAKKRNGVYTYRDGQRGLVIEVAPRYGHPSILAYKVLQSVFRKVTLEGKPYPDTVAFSFRELARLVGRDVFGGKDSKDLYQAIRQLEDTKVELVLYNRDGKEHRSYRFSLVIASGFIAEGEATNPDRLKAAAITLHPVIMDRMRQEHFAIFNWERLSALEPVTATLYKRLYLHFSNLYETEYDRKGLKFEKDYAALCDEWLGGLKRETYKSKIGQQLDRHFEALQQAGLLRSVSIERMADSKNFKLVFRPGAGFFSDYQTFYLGSRARVLQFQQTEDAANIKDPMELTAYFYRRLHKTEVLKTPIFSAKDIEFAKQLLTQFGDSDARDLMNYALEQAPLTKFDMKNIRGIQGYIPAWEAQQEKRAQRIAAQKLEAQTRRAEQLDKEYEDYCAAQLHAYLEQCPPAELEEIRQLAFDSIKDESPPTAMLHRVNLHIAEKRIVRSRCILPSFDTWLSNRA
jgi:hypothetical protein